MITRPPHHLHRNWLLRSCQWLALLWLGSPLVAVAQHPTDSLATRQTGMGVFGPALSIHADTLGVWGDVVFDSADVIGEGILSLRGHSPGKSAIPQRILAQHAQVQHLHLESSGKTILLGDLRIEKSLTVDKGVFDVSAGKLEKGDRCQIRLLRGAQVNNQPTWTIQTTDSKTRLTTTERLVGLNAEEDVRLFGYLAQAQQQPRYELSGYQFIEADNLDPPPKVKPV